MEKLVDNKLAKTLVEQRNTFVSRVGEHELYLVREYVSRSSLDAEGEWSLSDYYFSSDLKNAKSGKPYFYYLSESTFDLLKTKAYNELDTEDVNSFYVTDQEINNLSEVDVNRVGIYKDGFLFKWGKEAPLVRLETSDYIMGLNDRYYYFEEAVAHLASNPNVVSIKEVSIPSYNRESDYTVGAKITFLPTQEYIDEAWELLKKDSYKTVKLKYSYFPHHDADFPLDFLELKQFLRDFYDL